ncbi:MAG: mechanosensitive ion channel [Chloroflexi bacterium]|nr:mechanosensitive ion channel [Chloroflexota bacterium]
MTQFLEQLEQLAAAYGLKILGAIAIFFIGRWAAKILANAVKKLMEKSRVDQTLISFLNNLIYYILILLVIVAALGNLGVETTSIIAILGGATLAIGFALQDSLGNIAAGVMIIMLRPYRLKDIIGVNDEIGEVTDIQIFHTALITPTNKVTLIPNSQIISGNIVNYTEKGLYRYDMVFGIGYDDDLLKAKKVLLEILQDNEHIATTPAPAVIVGELGDNSVNLVAQPWIPFGIHPKVQAQITEQVKLRFDQEQISFPYPQRDVHLFQAN